MAGLASTSTTSSATTTSTPVFNSEDVLWAKIGTDLSWTNSFTLNYSPSSAINKHNLTFNVPSLASPNCMFLSDICLRLSLKLVDKSGNVPETGAKVSVTNLFSSTIIRGCTLFLNETQIGTSDAGTYGLKAYASVLTGLGFGAKHGSAQSMGWYDDGPEEAQLFDWEATGFLLRALLFGELKQEPKQSQIQVKYSDVPVEVYSRLFTDFAGCPLPVLSGISMCLELQLQDPSFSVLCRDSNAKDKAYSLELADAVLVVPVRSMSVGLCLDVEKRLASEPLSYGLMRLETKKITLPANIQSYTTDSLVQSSINPNRLFLVLISAHIYDGGYQTNALDFENYFRNATGVKTSLVRSVLSVNGVAIEQDPMGTSPKMQMSAFRTMYKALGQLDKREDCSISLKAFTNGKFMMFYDLTASGRAPAGHIARQPPKTGPLRLELTFSGPLPVSVYLFVFAEYPSAMVVDKNRSITYKYIA